MRNVVFVVLGFAILVAESAAAAIVPLRAFAPNLLLPLVIYLGVSHEVGVVRGAALSFVLGYLLDSFCGSPMGLQTFVLVATFLAARGAGLRLFARGPLFQILLTFVVAVAAGMTVIALRAIFEPPAPFAVSDVGQTVRVVLFPSLATAVFSPLVFGIVRRVDAAVTRVREEGASSV